MSQSVPGTIVLYGPAYQRSGFGMLARVWTLAFHAAGLKVRLVPIDCDDPGQIGGLNDCDIRLLRSLEYTPIVPPITAIVAYQPTYGWPRMVLPDPNVRIMLTTFDSSLAAASPPHRQIYICNQMDQTWLANATEVAAWTRVGLSPDRARSFNWPHDWIGNPRLSPPLPPVRSSGRRFRFLHISCYLPRRRLDALLRAFFAEFPGDDQAELYLKMTFPSWHPVQGKPRRDFFAMLDRVRRETGSRAVVTVDESLGTRLELARLVDSCDVYVSPDTLMTAPPAEAMLRRRLAIITSGWGVDLPLKDLIVVPNSDQLIPLTPEMAEYMPHQRGKTFPALDVSQMRQALRTAYSMPPDELAARADAAYDYMSATYSFETCAPSAIRAITEAWQAKAERSSKPVEISSAPAASAIASTPNPRGRTLLWGGLQLFHGKVPLANREICLELISRGHKLSLSPAHGPFQIEEMELQGAPELERLVDRFYVPIRGQADFGISSRWHPGFVEGRAKRHILLNTWWSGAIPVDWKRPIQDHIEEIWVPSTYVKENFVLGGVVPDRIQVVPFGINPLVFNRQSEPFPLRTRKRFRFLFVGEAGLRKGFDTLMLAYAKAFNAKDDVCLVVKDMNCEDYYMRSGGRDLIAHFENTANLPEVEYLNEMVDAKSMARLYSSCHCFVQPFRANSNGQAILEAMACELPVIATRHGGPLDFCDNETALLLDAHEITRRPSHVGHWHVDGPQRHAEVSVSQLVEMMRSVYHGSSRAAECAQQAIQRVRTHFTWKQTVDKIEERFEALELVAPRARGSNRGVHSASQAEKSLPSLQTPPPVPGTVVIVAPFHNRSGYGVGARSLAATLHQVGVRVKCLSVNDPEPGIDDCDMGLLHQLEETPVTGPVIAVFFHVPSEQWVKLPLPPGSKRVLYTTFDSSAQGNTPPAEWIRICNAMDQIWLMTPREAEVFKAGGVPGSKIRIMECPHHWTDNPLIPLPQPNVPVCPETKRFRFLSVAMFQPRRRWDTLVEAFLTEFAGEEPVELYLKVNYPSWHPVPGQPSRDFHSIIERLRAKTGSKAKIVVDEELGTRTQICALIDSCQIYVSTDTCVTAPVGEAFVRARPVILPDGLGAKLPLCEAAFVIPIDPGLQRPITESELLYQPHHRGRKMPLLAVEDVRRALRAGFETTAERREEMGATASVIMGCTYGGAAVVRKFVTVLHALSSAPQKELRRAPATPEPRRETTVAAAPTVAWEGTFLDLGSLSYVNRELTKALTRNPGLKIVRVVNQGVTATAGDSAELQTLAKSLLTSPPVQTQTTVRHAWPPDWRRPATGKLVVIQPWEFGALPAEWVSNSRHVDEFWVPSNYVREVYADSGVPRQKVKVVPNGIDPAKLRPEVPPMALATSKSFKFLFVGGTIYRKGPDVLLEAYLKAFTAQDDVCLVIKDFGGKSVYTGQTMEARIKAAQAHPNAPEILYLNTELPPEALPGLYTACNCLAHPYRGEGFGLPILEAMACGLPVIVTAGGAADDFAGEDFAYRIPATRKVFGDSVSGMKLAGPGWLLEPDSHALADRMKWVVEHRDEARAKGLRASDYVRREWTWERAAQIAAEHLQRLAPAAVLTPHPSTLNPQHPALVLPPCAHLGQLAPARQLLGCKKPREAWEATLSALRARPYHPEAYLLLAEIAAFAGDGHYARLCAEQAHHLAPDWKPARQFLNHPLKGNTRPDWLTLPERLQESGAGITHHAPAPRLSVCVIAKNEEKFLGQCLKSIKGLAQQIIVVDTGSTDRTVEIAKEYGAEVHQFNWCDDFGAARNAALEHARGDWILVLDADEELPADQQTRLQTDLANRKLIACRLPLVNRGQEAEGCSYVPRLFRNAPGIYFHGRIHEQVFPSLIPLSNAWGLPTGLGTAQLLHHGYTAELTRDRGKVERNLRLLRLAASETPEDANLMMNLGLELVRSGDLGDGLEHYRQAFQLMCAQPPGDIVPELREALLTQFTCHLYKVRAHEEVVSVLTSPLARKGGLTASMHFALGLSKFELKSYAESAEQMRQCLAKRQQPALAPINTDILTAAPYHCLAMCLTRLGDATGAEKAYEAGLAQKGRTEDLKLDYVKFLLDQNRPVDALHRLHEIVANNALDAAAWQLGGKVALSRPDFLEFARDWTTEAIRCLPQDAVVLGQRAEALLFNGDTAGARQSWERAWNNGHAPEALAGLVLCDILSGTAPQVPENELQVLEASRAFVALYQRSLAARAQTIVSGVNERISELRCALPTAAMMIETALAEANQPAAVCPA